MVGASGRMSAAPPSPPSSSAGAGPSGWQPPPSPTSDLARPPDGLTPWGAFRSPAVEAAFWRDTHALLARSNDLLVLSLTTAGFVVGAVHTGPRVLLGPAPVAVVRAMGAALVAATAAARAWPDALAARRVVVMPCIRVVCLGITIVAVGRGTPPGHSGAEATLPAGAAGWVLFLLKSPRVHGLLLSGPGIVLPPVPHAAFTAASAVLTLAALPKTATSRETYIPRAMHVRAAAALSSASAALGFGGRRSIPDDRAALAVLSVMQLTAIVASCVLHHVRATGMRRRWRRRVLAGAAAASAGAEGSRRRRGGPPPGCDGDDDRMESVDTLVLGAAVVVATAVAVWLAAETAWGV